MMLSVMVVGAGAAFSDQSKIKNTEAVDACTALNIIGGYPDGSFKPEGNITRAEVTKMICVALNGGKEPNLATNATPTFSDVRTNANSAWAEKYIESCASQGIVSGVGGGKFAPAGNVTGTQLAKMLLVSLGYKSENEGFTGNAWATNVNVRAAQKGLYEGLEKMDTNAAITRDNAAQMVWNALNAYEVEYKTTLVTDSKGQLTSQITVQDKVVGNTNDKITLLEDKYEAITVKGVLTGVNFNDNDDTYTTDIDLIAPYNDSEKDYADNFDADRDYSALMGQQVKVMYTVDNKTKDVTLLGIYASDKNKTVTALGDDMDYSSDTKVEINNKDYELNLTKIQSGDSAKDAIVAPNGSLVKDQSILDATNDKVSATPYYQYTLVDNDNNKKYEYAVVTPFSVAQIDYLSSSKVTLSAKGGTSLTKSSFDLKDDDVTLYKDAAEDDYVVVVDKAYTVSGNTEITKASVVSGKVDATKSKNIKKGETTQSYVSEVKVDGTWYKVADPTDTGDTIKLNDSYDLTVVNGFVFNAEKTKGNISAENVLYMDKYAALTSGLSDGIEAKVYFTNGSSKTVTLTNITPATTTNTDALVNYETTSDGTTTKHYYQASEDYDIVADVYKTVTTGEGEKQKTTQVLDTTKKDHDEIFASQATALLKDYYLYTYSEKSGDYSVEPVSANNIGSYDKYVTEVTTTKTVEGKTVVDQVTIKDGKTTDRTRFTDDGVIFVKDKDGVKVVSGKTVANWKETDVAGVYGLADKSNGTYYVSVGLIKMDGTAKSDTAIYGFITSDISTTKADGTTYYTFDMWNGTKTVEGVKVDTNDVNASNTPVKYGFVSFNWEDESTLEAAGDDFIVKTAGTATTSDDTTTVTVADADAITAFVTDDSITFQKGTTTGDSKTTQQSFDFADTYFVIGVDTKNGEGASAKLATAKDAANQEGKINANAVYFLVKDGKDYVVEAVFIDVNGVMTTDKNGSEIYLDKN